MSGTMIDNTVVGGPAHSSKELEHGDVILKVDGSEATEENIFQLLVGSDVPGSIVEITIAKGGVMVSIIVFDLSNMLY